MRFIGSLTSIAVAYKKYFNHKQIIPLNKNDETLKGYRIKNAKSSFLVLKWNWFYGNDLEVLI